MAETEQAKKSEKSEQIMKQMDEAAARAEEELQKNFGKWSAKDVAIWWMTWYLKAGHKRLGRALVTQGKRSF